MALQYKQTQDKFAKQMGFDYSSECFIKGEHRIVILIDIGGLHEIQGQPIEPEKDENFWIVMIFEMDPIKVDMFDCDQFIITIDDLVVQLIESLKTDKEDYEDY